jgi:hypothetical protein
MRFDYHDSHLKSTMKIKDGSLWTTGVVNIYPDIGSRQRSHGNNNLTADNAPVRAIPPGKDIGSSKYGHTDTIKGYLALCIRNPLKV